MNSGAGTAALVRRSLGYGLATVIPGVINFFALTLYTRLLTPEEYGRYALALSWVALGNAILFQWIRLGVRRFLAKYESERQSFLSTVSAAYVSMAMLASVGGALAILSITERDDRIMIGIAMALLWVQTWVELSLENVLVAGEPRRYGGVSATRAVVAVLLGWLFASRGYGAVGLVLGLALGYLIAGLPLTARYWTGVSWHGVNRELFRSLVRYGAPLSGTLALEFVINSSDRIFLSVLSGAASVGVYAATYDLGMQVLTMLMVSVGMAAFPVVVRTLEQSGPEAAREQLRGQSVIFAAVALPSACGLGALSSNISFVFLGRDFQSSARQLLPIIALAALLFGVKTLFFDLAFQLGASTKGQLIVSGAAALVNVLLNLLLIPSVGALGAAYATAAAYGVGVFLSWRMGRRVFVLPYAWNEWMRIAVAVGVMLVVLFPVAENLGGQWLVLQVAAGASAYGLAVLALDVGGVRQWMQRTLSRG